MKARRWSKEEDGIVMDTYWRYYLGTGTTWARGRTGNRQRTEVTGSVDSFVGVSGGGGTGLLGSECQGAGGCQGVRCVGCDSLAQGNAGGGPGDSESRLGLLGASIVHGGEIG